MSEDLFDSNASFKENITSLSKGNPGALTALTELVDIDPAKASLVMEDMAKMNMYGPRIWIGYSDYCDEDAVEFADSILNRDEELVETINNLRGDDGEPVELPR